MAKGPADDIQNLLQSFVNTTSTLLYQVGDTLREQATKSKDLVEEKLKERELSQAFMAFGKATFGLVAKEKLELPSALDTHLDKIRSIVREIEVLQQHAAAAAKSSAPSDAAPPEDSDEDA